MFQLQYRNENQNFISNFVFQLIQEVKPWGKTVENLICLHYFNNFNKNWGWRGGLLYFIGKHCKLVSGKLEYKLQATVPMLCWYFFNLNKKTVVRKEKILQF